MDRVVDHLLVFKGEGKVDDFPGNYSQYRNWSELKEKEEEEAKKAEESAKALFGAGGNNANMPTSTLTDADFENGNINVLSMLVATGLCPSRGEARRLVQQGGVTIDDVKVASIDESLARERFEGEGVIVRKGKKVFHRVKV